MSQNFSDMITIVTWFENLFGNSIVSSLNQDQNILIVLTLSFQNKHRHRKTNKSCGYLLDEANQNTWTL